MSALFPSFFGSSKKAADASSSKRTNWQQSGPELRREGARKKSALTSIHNISREDSSSRTADHPVSSIARAGQSASSSNVQDRGDQREADDRRYAHIRRLIKEKKIKKAEMQKKKKRGLFF